MSGLQYAPEFRLEVEGEVIPAVLRASVTGLSLQTGFEGADRLEIALVNENLRWLDSPLLNIDNEVKLHLGYTDTGLEQMFAGEIVSKAASFPSGGVPVLNVAAQDRRRKLQRGKKVRWFAIPIPTVGNFPLPDLATAAIVSAENGLIPLYDPVGAAISILIGGVEAAAAVTDPDNAQKVIRKQANESDADFLAKLAAENGWDLVMEHRGPLGGYLLHFFSALDYLSSDVTLRYGRSLIDFSPRLTSVGQIYAVSAYIWVAQIKTVFTITVAWDWDRMALTLDIMPSLIPMGKGPTNFLIKEPVTPISAPRRILSELIPRLNKRLTASGSCAGNPLIRAGSVLRIEGVGVEFGGLYRVTSATHELDSGGYRTRFEARKEIWFGSIPAAEQGASPVQVSVL